MKRFFSVIILVFSTLAFGQEGPVLVDGNTFLGATQYFFTGEQRRLCWRPDPENIPWEGNYVFDIEVYHYERKELIHAVYALEALETTFILPRTGHYWARAELV